MSILDKLSEVFVPDRQHPLSLSHSSEIIHHSTYSKSVSLFTSLSRRRDRIDGPRAGCTFSPLASLCLLTHFRFCVSSCASASLGPNSPLMADDDEMAVSSGSSTRRRRLSGANREEGEADRMKARIAAAISRKAQNWMGVSGRTGRFIGALAGLCRLGGNSQEMCSFTMGNDSTPCGPSDRLRRTKARDGKRSEDSEEKPKKADPLRVAADTSKGLLRRGASEMPEEARIVRGQSECFGRQ